MKKKRKKKQEELLVKSTFVESTYDVSITNTDQDHIRSLKHELVHGCLRVVASVRVFIEFFCFILFANL